MTIPQSENSRVKMKTLCVAVATVALLMLVGCSSEPSKPAEKPQPKPPDFLTGRAAFQRLYAAARGRSVDAQPYRLESQITADAKGQDGKSAVWRASFASTSQRSTRPYVWSGEESSDAPARGISPGNEDSYNPNNSSTQVFDMGFLKVDSDKALAAAQKHGGDKLLEKKPDTAVWYVLDWNRPTNELLWHVIYGSDRDNAALRIDVSATSGEYVRTQK
jgi:hypothetical protein